MGRIGGREDAANENPSIPAPSDGIAGGYHIRPHLDLPFEEREPGLVDYQPDLGGSIQGADATQVLPTDEDDAEK